MKPEIFVHCTKPMLIVHHHPHLMKVPGQADKPHLAEPHDHHVKITVRMRCEHLERDKDLLLLHHNLEEITKFPKRVHMGQASFEQICVLLVEKLKEREVSVHSIKLDAHDEGCVLVYPHPGIAA